ncbi:MAG: zf-HC2 domain-containing protein [Anaerolineae bacterium]|jgi:hypothetical protein
MNCEQTCHLVDDYLENRLSRYERQRLEMHIAYCPECAEELRNRPAFERTMWRALSSSVQDLYLSPGASQQIVREAQATVGRAVWSARIAVGARVMAGVAAVVLVFFAVLVLTGRVEVPVELNPAAQPQAGGSSLSLTSDDVFVEPWVMRPGQPFTVTVFLRSNLEHAVDTVFLDLDVDGPSGEYHFAVAAKGPIPARGVSVIELTPDLLEIPCWEQYGMTPSEIMNEPGIYTLRTVLSVPSVPRER